MEARQIPYLSSNSERPQAWRLGMDFRHFRTLQTDNCVIGYRVFPGGENRGRTGATTESIAAAEVSVCHVPGRALGTSRAGATTESITGADIRHCRLDRRGGPPWMDFSWQPS